MAYSKTTKKKTVAVKAQTVKTVEQLKTELAEKKQDMLDSRKSLIAGEMVNPRAIRTLRKDIARLLTAIREDEIKSQKGNK
jgi:large subunit ribosomal protein L29